MTRHPIEVDLEKSPSGTLELARVRFGPHYVLEVRDNGTSTTLLLVATHHGFRADASEVSGELEQIIEEVRKAHPDAVVD